MRFAVGKNFAADKKVVPGIAVGIEPNIFHTNMQPSTSALFPLDVWSIGGNMMLIPKVRVRLNERLSFFGKIPFGLAAFSWERVRMNIPAIRTEEQVTNTMNFEIGLSRLQLNIGLGVDI